MEPQEFDVDSLNFPESTDEATPVAQGNDETPTETVSVPDTVEVETPVVETKQDTAPEIKISDPPSQYDGESEIQYNLRKQIYDAGQAKAQAETTEEKSELAKHIKGLRMELGKSSKSHESIAPEIKIEANESFTQEQSEEELAKIALEKMGYVSKDKIEEMVKTMLQNQTTQDQHLSATKEFYSSHKDIAANPAQRETLERFVVDKFNITPQSTKQDLLIAMDMARTYLFPKTDTRVQRAAVSADKRDLVSISSNTQSVPTTNKNDIRASKALEEMGVSMKDMGWED